MAGHQLQVAERLNNAARLASRLVKEALFGLLPAEPPPPHHQISLQPSLPCMSDTWVYVPEQSVAICPASFFRGSLSVEALLCSVWCPLAPCPLPGPQNELREQLLLGKMTRAC